ncbi:MAG TPA: PA14 domain-containing protein [Archangium sp.]|nr:PA14 domain-containing protein [Archangium sp.]
MHSLGSFRSVLLFSSVACLAASQVGCGEERGGAVTLESADAPLATGNGVWGDYYSGTNFDTLRLRRYDAFIDFWWNTASPDAVYLGADNFSVRWEAQLQPAFSETYTFYSQSDDGIRLWVNGEKLIDNWTVHPLTENSGTITLTAGRRYSFRVDYFESTGPATSSLLWSSPSQPKQVIPQSAFSYAPLSAPVLEYNPPGSRYAYAPAVVNDGSGTTRIYSCYNPSDGVIKDSILLVEKVGGSVTRTATVLSPSASGWNSLHICDPTVVQGAFTYNGVTYSHAMFYTGNDSGSVHNQIGVAFANSLGASSWVKYPQPLIPFPAGEATSHWGVGQPSVTAVDGKGRVLLFYTQGDSQGTRVYRRELSLGNMAAPIIGAPVLVTTAGLTELDGGGAFLNNVDFAYDASRDRFYAIREFHPYPASYPDFISEQLELISIPGADIWNGGGAWRHEATVNGGLTGRTRNHNAGLERTPWGGLSQADKAHIYYTVSCSGTGCSWPGVLWTYDEYSTFATLP